MQLAGRVAVVTGAGRGIGAAAAARSVPVALPRE
jgi:NAD(P)-dependent dehydrogenase (short-subunit alcohol dehydrogenase family)